MPMINVSRLYKTMTLKINIRRYSDKQKGKTAENEQGRLIFFSTKQANFYSTAPEGKVWSQVLFFCFCLAVLEK